MKPTNNNPKPSTTKVKPSASVMQQFLKQMGEIPPGMARDASSQIGGGERVNPEELEKQRQQELLKKEQIMSQKDNQFATRQIGALEAEIKDIRIQKEQKEITEHQEEQRQKQLSEQSPSIPQSQSKRGRRLGNTGLKGKKVIQQFIKRLTNRAETKTQSST